MSNILLVRSYSAPLEIIYHESCTHLRALSLSGLKMCDKIPKTPDFFKKGLAPTYEELFAKNVVEKLDVQSLSEMYLSNRCLRKLGIIITTFIEKYREMRQFLDWISKIKEEELSGISFAVQKSNQRLSQNSEIDQEEGGIFSLLPPSRARLQQVLMQPKSQALNRKIISKNIIETFIKWDFSVCVNKLEKHRFKGLRQFLRERNWDAKRLDKIFVSKMTQRELEIKLARHAMELRDIAVFKFLPPDVVLKVSVEVATRQSIFEQMAAIVLEKLKIAKN